jgi:hypothetical protein
VLVSPSWSGFAGHPLAEDEVLRIASINVRYDAMSDRYVPGLRRTAASDRCASDDSCSPTRSCSKRRMSPASRRSSNALLIGYECAGVGRDDG